MLFSEKFFEFCAGLATLLSCAQCFIIPEEFPSLLSLIYSSIPPVKKGTDSRVGIGFNLGQHADFQILLELGPQTHTDTLGSANPEYAAKREVFVMKNTKNLMDYVNKMKNYFLPEKKKDKKTEKISNTIGGKWIDWWRNNILTQKEIGKIQFNKVPGIDDRIENNTKKIYKNRNDESSVVEHLSKLYKGKPDS